jgi:hypothetical protein
MNLCRKVNEFSHVLPGGDRFYNNTHAMLIGESP